MAEQSKTDLLIENAVLRASGEFGKMVDTKMTAQQEKTEQLVKDLQNDYAVKVDAVQKSASDAKRLAGQAHDRIDKIWVKVWSGIGLASTLAGGLVFAIEQLRR